MARMILFGVLCIAIVLTLVFSSWQKHPVSFSNSTSTLGLKRPRGRILKPGPGDRPPAPHDGSGVSSEVRAECNCLNDTSGCLSLETRLWPHFYEVCSSSYCSDLGATEIISGYLIEYERMSSDKTQSNKRLLSPYSGNSWQTSIHFFFTNTSVNIGNSSCCLCERKLLQLAILDIASSVNRGDSITASLPILSVADNTTNTKTNGRIIKVTLTLTSNNSKDVLLNAVKALSFTMKDSFPNEMTQTIRSYASGDSMKTQVSTIADIIACSNSSCFAKWSTTISTPSPTYAGLSTSQPKSSPSQKNKNEKNGRKYSPSLAPTQSTSIVVEDVSPWSTYPTESQSPTFSPTSRVKRSKPTPDPTWSPTAGLVQQEPTWSPTAGLVQQEPTWSPTAAVMQLNLAEECTKYADKHFHTDLWGLYGAHYGAQAGSLDSTASDPMYYRGWLIALLVAWAFASLYICWKIFIGYTACAANFSIGLISNTVTLGRSRRLEIRKGRLQLMQVLVAVSIVVSKVVYISLVMSLTANAHLSSFACVDLSPFMDSEEPFFGSGLFYCIFGLFPPLLLLCCVLRYRVLECVLWQLRGTSKNSTVTNTVAAICVFVSVVSLCGLLSIYILDPSSASVSDHSSWADMRRWGIVTQAICSGLGIIFQVAIASQITTIPRPLSLDNKLRQTYSSYAVNTRLQTEPPRARDTSYFSLNAVAMERGRTDSVIRQRVSTGTSDSDDGSSDRLDIESNNGKLKINRQSRNIDINDDDDIYSTESSTLRRPFGYAAFYPAPPKIDETFTWMVLTGCCIVVLLTSIPTITTGSFFGSFVLYSCIQRVMELVAVYASLRFIHVKRSMARATVGNQARRVRYVEREEPLRTRMPQDHVQLQYLSTEEMSREGTRPRSASPSPPPIFDRIPPPLPRSDSLESRSSSVSSRDENPLTR